MKIKDLIKHLETLDQEKELIIIATDPTGWDYGAIVDENSITEDTVYLSDENELSEYFVDEDDMDEDGEPIEVECYVIRMDC